MTQVSEVQKRQTAKIKAVNRPASQPDSVNPPLTFEAGADCWVLLIEIGESSTVLKLEVSNQILIGRADLMDGHTPDLDLGPYGGGDYGVSRKHAVMSIEEGRLFIRDLASTNGTRVNGFALEPEQPHKLNQGDEIELGQLRFLVSSLHAPEK